MENDKPNPHNYHILPGPKMGLVTPEYLEQVAALVAKHKIPFVKLTGAQRIAIAGHSEKDAEKIWLEMGYGTGPVQPAGIH
jgi:NAD(P)H-nitrite reductase large subunit